MLIRGYKPFIYRDLYFDDKKKGNFTFIFADFL